MCFAQSAPDAPKPPPVVIPKTAPDRVSEDVLAARQRALAKRGRGFIGADKTGGVLSGISLGTTATGLFSPAAGGSTSGGLFS